MMDGVNDTAIVLIPKVPRPKDLKDFRRISLCSVIYKIASICLVNRVCPLLTKLILENQSVFIHACLIYDNSILAFECIHYIQPLKEEDLAFCAYKMDPQKLMIALTNGASLNLGFIGLWRVFLLLNIK